MKTKMLIEHEKSHPTWRIVARDCTRDGLSRYRYSVLKNDIPNLPAARDEFGWIKQAMPRPRVN